MGGASRTVILFADGGAWYAPKLSKTTTLSYVRWAEERNPS
jgi:hypothetical protein